MNLIKYRDEVNGETEYSYFWVHKFLVDDVERVVSPVFRSEQEAKQWAIDMRQKFKYNQRG